MVRCWRRRWMILVVSGMAFFGQVLFAVARPRSPAGDWLIGQGGAVVRIEPCMSLKKSGLCGYIVGIILASGRPTPMAWNGSSQCGFLLLKVQHPDAASRAWRGRIINPHNGHAYGVALHVSIGGRLAVRGYLGLPLLGETQYWKPYALPVPRDCRIASGKSAGRLHS